MFKQNEMFFVKPGSFGFSNVIRDRVADNSPSFKPDPVGTIKTSSDRNELIKYLQKQDNKFIEELQLRRVDTEGRHDVVFGGQPLGDFYFSDMISGLYNIEPSDHVLDFGCSTGRVIRNLRSAFNFNAYGCDPRAESIAFNKQNFTDVEWFQSNEAPPILSNCVHKFDMVFAISVWSHFSPIMAKKWFDEFHKLLNPQGKLIFTTHGTRSVYHIHSRLKKMDDKPAEERLNTLREGGFHYKPYPSGSDLDSTHWGMAFISRKWLEETLSDRWTISSYLPGMAMENQDVYVLEVKR